MIPASRRRSGITLIVSKTESVTDEEATTKNSKNAKNYNFLGEQLAR
jgi:hypothetical protein